MAAPFFYTLGRLLSLKIGPQIFLKYGGIL